jgi:hypothetical protein
MEQALSGNNNTSNNTDTNNNVNTNRTQELKAKRNLSLSTLNNKK